jgi:glycosyltransferase involved in cell wall biosynthesis
MTGALRPDGNADGFSVRLALIVNTADQPEYLRRVLRAIDAQSSLPEEVLLADDGSRDDTREVFARWMPRPNQRREHVWQEKAGFRRARILNMAIAQARSEYIVFLDGDTVPHPEFIADHRRLARRGTFIQGHRALVRQGASTWFGVNGLLCDRRRAFWRGQLQGLKHAFRWPCPLVRVRTDLRGIRGCNLALWREDLVRCNGYNEEFVGWGREDSELAVRLMNLGLRRLDARGWAICWHLWHPPADRGGLPANDELLVQAQRSHATRCHKGLAQHIARS